MVFKLRSIAYIFYTLLLILTFSCIEKTMVNQSEINSLLFDNEKNNISGIAINDSWDEIKNLIHHGWLPVENIQKSNNGYQKKYQLIKHWDTKNELMVDLKLDSLKKIAEIHTHLSFRNPAIILKSKKMIIDHLESKKPDYKIQNGEEFRYYYQKKYSFVYVVTQHGKNNLIIKAKKTNKIPYSIGEKRVDKISNLTKKNDLPSLYPNAMIKQTVIDYFDNKPIFGTQLILENKQDELKIKWLPNDYPEYIMINSKNTSWNFQGIKIGSTLREVEVINKIGFTIHEFETNDRKSGFVNNWNNGVLKNLEVQFQPFVKKLNDSIIDLKNNSSDSISNRSKLIVKSIKIHLNK